VVVAVGLDNAGLVDKEKFAKHHSSVISSGNLIDELSGTVLFVMQTLLTWYQNLVDDRQKWHPTHDYTAILAWHSVSQIVLSQSLMRRHNYELPDGHGVDLGKQQSVAASDESWSPQQPEAEPGECGTTVTYNAAEWTIIALQFVHSSTGALNSPCFSWS